jgi:transposase
MAQTVCILLGEEDRTRLAAIVGDRNRPQKHVQRARIVLLSADRLPVLAVASRTDASRPAVWRWQQRFAEQGVDGLLRDKTRKPGKKPLPAATVAKILALPCGKPPRQATHWTGRMVAKAVGVSLRAVQRIWEANRLQPHRVRTFKTSNDPAFAEKVEDVVGLYMNPPIHAVVISIDEKSQIQALDRTQPGLPMKPGKCGTMTHHYKRNGTTTLFAALNILDGTVVGRCMPSHTHKEFIKFLNAVERAVRPGRIIHAIADNYATHKHPKVKRWLADHPRWVFHFTQLQHPGSTPSKASSQSSPADKSDVASSNLSPTSKTPSAATSESTTNPQNHSSGPNQPTPSSPNSADCLYLLNESVH